MRLFISINFDEKTKQNILGVQSRLKRLGRGTFSRPENLHLTLAFLGEVDESLLSKLKTVMDSVPMDPLTMEFTRIGCFRSDSELWWLGIEQNPALMELQKRLIAALKKEGFRPDTKAFKPHITLARRMHIGHADPHYLLPAAFKTRVSHMYLMLSQNSDGLLSYTQLYKK